MQTLTTSDGLEAQAAAAARTMGDGGVVLLPTDTVYGLACRPDHPEAIEAIYRIKARPRDRRLPVIVTGAAQAAALGVDWTDAAARLAQAFWPGALTIAVGVAPDAPAAWLAGRDEVGLRAPDAALAQALAGRAGPFLMTSANLHAQATAPSLAEVLQSLAEPPDLAIDGGELDVVASTVVNANLTRPEVVREGAVPTAEIARVLGA